MVISPCNPTVYKNFIHEMVDPMFFYLYILSTSTHSPSTLHHFEKLWKRKWYPNIKLVLFQKLLNQRNTLSIHYKLTALSSLLQLLCNSNSNFVSSYSSNCDLSWALMSQPGSKYYICSRTPRLYHHSWQWCKAMSVFYYTPETLVKVEHCLFGASFSISSCKLFNRYSLSFT